MTRKLVSTLALLLRPRPVFASDALASDGGEKAGSGYGGPSFLGVDVQDISPERAQALKLSGTTGIEITMVDRDAPAGKAGLKEHDVVLKFGDTPVESVEQIRRLLRETPACRTVNLTISRDGQTMSVPVTLAQRREAYGYTFTMPEMPRMPKPPKMQHFEMPQVDVILHQYSGTGLMIENLTPQLREFFGVKPGEGVLVRSVEKNSSAATAGFKAGDVIVSVGKEKISDLGDWRTTVAMQKGKVAVGVVRDRKEQTLTLTLPAKKDSSRIVPLVPEISIDTEELDRELARIRPQLEELRKQTQSKEFQDEMRRAQKHAQEEVRRSMEEMRKELERQKEELQPPDERD